MLRCGQLIFRLRNNNGSSTLLHPRPSPDVKVSRTFYSAKPNLRDSPPMTRKAVPNGHSTEVCSSLCKSSSKSTNNSLVCTGAAELIVLGSDKPASIRKCGTRIGRDKTDQPLEAGANSPQHQTPTKTLEAALIQVPPTTPISSSSDSSQNNAESSPLHGHSYKEAGGIALIRDPPTGLVDAPVSVPEFNNAHELIQKWIGATDFSLPQPSDFDILRSTLRCFGPQLVCKLGAAQSAGLLCLLGTISDKTPSKRYCFPNTRFRGVHVICWEEVIKVVEMKQELGHEFGEKEIYWTMRAYLERFNQGNCSASRDMAKLYYSRLSTQAQSEPSVLVPYLNAFLVHPSTPEFEDTLNILCTSLSRECNPTRALVECLWRVVLKHGAHFSQVHKSTILQVMRHRLSYFDSLSSGNPSNIIGGISMGYAASFFPCYRKSGLSTHIASWIKKRLCASFSEEKSLSEQFNTLTLVARWLSLENPSRLSQIQVACGNTDLRAILGVAMLDQSLSSRTVTIIERTEIRSIARSLFNLWKHAAVLTRPKEVERAIAIAFLRISLRLRDEILLKENTEHIFSGISWTVSFDPGSETEQVEQLFTALADCACVFKDRFWSNLVNILGNGSHRSFHNLCLRNVLQQIAYRDAGLAYQFYDGCRSSGIAIPSETSFTVAQQLVSIYSWNNVAMILKDDQFDGKWLEQLLKITLSSLRKDRQQYVNPILAEALGVALLRRFSKTGAPEQFKYLIRYFLPIMITSFHPKTAIEVLEVLLRNNPAMFSPRFILRMIHTFLRHRQPSLAIKVVVLAAASPLAKSAAVNSLVRKTREGLIRAGAPNLVLHPVLTVHQTAPKSLRDRLVLLATRKFSRHTMLQLFPTLTTAPVDASSILAAVLTLTRRRYFALAKQLIKRSSCHLKTQDLTLVGNAYLHAPLLHNDPRNKRLIRHVLRSKDYLVQEYGFTPDRVTVNIIIKAMLRWRTYIDSRMVLSLFDHLVRNGYPASERWHVANGVPFGTTQGVMALDLSGIRQNISFRRHVRPLYRTFIKELFLRKNPRAAHRVVGILKEEEALVLETEQHRQRARRLGVLKQQRRRALERMTRGDKVET